MHPSFVLNQKRRGCGGGQKGTGTGRGVKLNNDELTAFISRERGGALLSVEGKGVGGTHSTATITARLPQAHFGILRTRSGSISLSRAHDAPKKVIAESRCCRSAVSFNVPMQDKQKNLFFDTQKSVELPRERKELQRRQRLLVAREILSVGGAPQKLRNLKYDF